MDMDAFDEFLLWTNVLLEILGGDLAGGFYGWYFATKMFGPEYAQTGIWIGVTNRHIPITNNIKLKEFLSNHDYYSGSAENGLQVVI